MIEYQKSTHSLATVPSVPLRASISCHIIKTASASGATLSQGSGLACFNSLACSLSCPTVVSNGGNSNSDMAATISA
jgi:hypothetical protein